MNTEREWAVNAFPPEVIVLNLRLRSYSCGHEVLLSRIASPFLFGSPATRVELFTAALLCSMSYEQGEKFMRKPKLGLFGHLWGRLLDDSRIEEQTLAFTEYLLAGSWSPPTNAMVGKGYASRELKAPRVYRLINFVCANLGLSIDAAMDFPMSRANAHYAANADLEGTIDLSGGRAENDLLRHLADMEARAEKGENVWDL